MTTPTKTPTATHTPQDPDMLFCPECDGRTYLGDIGFNERRCPTCDGAGILSRRLIAAAPALADMLREFAAIAGVIVESGDSEYLCGVCERAVRVNDAGTRERGHGTDCAVLRARALLATIDGRDRA